jgi:hypothetical protein
MTGKDAGLSQLFFHCGDKRREKLSEEGRGLEEKK